jgi:hypothetical protein
MAICLLLLLLLLLPQVVKVLPCRCLDVLLSCAICLRAAASSSEGVRVCVQ